jgi:TatD DNase family protein
MHAGEPHMATFYDTHAHLDFPDFAADLDEVMDRAREAGIAKIITIGTDLESSARAVRLAERFENVSAVVGWHPGHASEAPADIRAPLRELAKHPKVVAIGETGLDYYRLPGKPDEDARIKARQADLFAQQLEVAAELGLNVVLHERAAFEDVLAQFTPHATRVRGVFHCFGGTVAAMRRIVALGSLVSFTGIVTFKNAQTVRDTLTAVPAGSFMFETDCPFLAPMPFRGKRCEPAHVREIAAFAAQVRGCALDELGATTCATAAVFFRGLG